MPHYYLQNFGSATSHPDTNEYAAFAQDTIRVTNHLAVNLGVRWDLQTFTTPRSALESSVPACPAKFHFSHTISLPAPGWHTPWATRARWSFARDTASSIVRIPQIYNSVIQTENGITNSHLFLNKNTTTTTRSSPHIPTLW